MFRKYGRILWIQRIPDLVGIRQNISKILTFINCFALAFERCLCTEVADIYLEIPAKSSCLRQQISFWTGGPSRSQNHEHFNLGKIPAASYFGKCLGSKPLSSSCFPGNSSRALFLLFWVHIPHISVTQNWIPTVLGQGDEAINHKSWVIQRKKKKTNMLKLQVFYCKNEAKNWKHQKFEIFVYLMLWHLLWVFLC